MPDHAVANPLAIAPVFNALVLVMVALIGLVVTPAAVARGEAVFGPKIADRVVGFFAAAAHGRGPDPFPQLTAREREILDLLARGWDNVTIARRLVVSDKTVRNHVSAVLTKLQVASRAEAVALARDAGIGPVP